MEDGVATHGHQYFYGVIWIRRCRIRYFDRVTDDTEREVIGAAFSGTCITRLFSPARFRYIRVTYLACALTEPAPPSEEVVVANRQLHILLGVVIEDTFVLMHLLHTVGSQRIARSTGRVNQMLVVGILEITGLGYGQLFCDDIHLVTNDDNIEDTYIRHTRRTDTALRTLHRDGGVSLTGDTTPSRLITEFVQE